MGTRWILADIADLTRVPFRRRATIVADASARNFVNGLFHTHIDNEGGDRTMTVGLVPIGSPAGTPATHYICSAAMREATWDRLRELWEGATSLQRSRIRIYNGNTKDPEDILDELGLQKRIA